MTPLNSSFKITSSSLEFSSSTERPLSGCWGTKEPVYFSSLRHSANYTTFISLFPLAASPCDSHPNMNVKGYPWLACFPLPTFPVSRCLFLLFFFWLHHAATWDLSFPTRDQTRTPLQWSTVLTAGPPGKSHLDGYFLLLVLPCLHASMILSICFHFPGFPKLYWSLAQHSSPSKPSFSGDLTATPLKVSWLVYKTLCIQHNLHMPPATQLPSFRKPRAQVQPHPLNSGRNWASLS